MGNQMWLKFNRPFDRVGMVTVRKHDKQQLKQRNEQKPMNQTKATAIADASSHQTKPKEKREYIHSTKIPLETESTRIVIVTFAYGLCVFLFLSRCLFRVFISLDVSHLYSLFLSVSSHNISLSILLTHFTELSLWINHNSNKHWMLFVLCLNFISIHFMIQPFRFTRDSVDFIDLRMGFLWLRSHLTKTENKSCKIERCSVSNRKHAA